MGETLQSAILLTKWPIGGYVMPQAKTAGWWLSRSTVHVLLVIVCAVVIFPVFWMVSTSLRTAEATLAIPPFILPPKLTFQAYADLFSPVLGLPYGRFILNSIIVTASSTLIAVGVSFFAAYGLARFRLIGGLPLLILFLASQMFPGASVMIPMYFLVDNIGWMNTLRGIILVYVIFRVPFCTFLLMGFIKGLPSEIEDAASIDGCGRISILFRIVFPLIVPGIIATILFGVMGAWNEFLYASILTVSEEMKTLAAGSESFVGQYITMWNWYTAHAVLFALPPVILFLILQKQFISGVTRGAVHQ